MAEYTTLSSVGSGQCYRVYMNSALAVQELCSGHSASVDVPPNASLFVRYNEDDGYKTPYTSLVFTVGAPLQRVAFSGSQPLGGDLFVSADAATKTITMYQLFFKSIHSSDCLSVNIRGANYAVGCGVDSDTLSTLVNSSSQLQVYYAALGLSTDVFSVTSADAQEFGLKNKAGVVVAKLVVTPNIESAELDMAVQQSDASFTTLHAQECLTVTLSGKQTSLGCPQNSGEDVNGLVTPETLLSVTSASTSATTDPFYIKTASNMPIAVDMKNVSGAVVGTLVITPDVGNTKLSFATVYPGGGGKPANPTQKHKQSVGMYIGIALVVVAALVIIIVPTVLVLRKRKRVS